MTGIVDLYLSQIEHEIRAFCLKKFNILVHYPTTKIFAQKVLKMGWKNEVSQTDNFYSLAGVYHQYVFKYLKL